MKGIHGGDIYRNHVEMDFSVNIHPFGIPETVKEALHEAVSACGAYPDIQAEALKRAIGRKMDLPEERILLGNGASELFMAAVHGLQPKKTVIPVPSFFGYSYAAEASGGEILYYEMKKEQGWELTEDFFSVLDTSVDLLFLANPNNPTGKLLDRTYIRKLLEHCRKQGIYVILDECFIEFCGKEKSMLSKLGEWEHLMIVRAFTKLYAIPGVRLGYLACGNKVLAEKIQKHLPEWNISGFAQAAGCACCALPKSYEKETADLIRKERKFLEEGLKKAGLEVLQGDANFILLYTKKDLYAYLLRQGILIRDCGNYIGLTKGYYRIAVKTRAENEHLLRVIENGMEED